MTQATARTFAKEFFGGAPAVPARPTIQPLRLPPAEPGSPRAKAALERMTSRKTCEAVPPEHRPVVNCCSEFCLDCRKFTQNGGGCPGTKRPNFSEPFMPSKTAPLCMIHLNGRLENPLEVNGKGELALAAGQEKFWRFSQIATNAWAVAPINDEVKIL